MKHFRNNPRKISKAQIDRLKKTMQKYGDLSGITHILETDELITGNQRSDAGDFINQKPIIEQQFNPPLKDGTVAIGYFDMDGVRFNYRAVQGWTTAEQQEANLIANAAGGDWDWKLLETFPVELLNSAGFDEDMLKGDKVNLKGLQNFVDSQEPAETVDAEPQIERADELLKKWGVLYGDLWKVGGHKLLCGNSAERDDVAGLMGEEKATLLFSDPPYGVSIGDKNKFLNKFQKSGRVLTSIEADDDTPEDLGEMLLQVFTLSKEFLTDDCSIFVCSPQGGSLGMMMMRDAGMEVRHVLNWIKNSPTFSLGRLDYDYQHEPILFTWIKKHKKIMLGQFKTSTWTVNKPMANKEHPTMKPIELYENALLNHTETNDILYEPFGGSGTGMVACENHERVCRMMELTPRYCAVTLERMSTAFPYLEIKRL